MSINVGYLNGNYQYNSFRNNNTLTLNSFNDSNIILLNCDGNSTADVLINHRNIIKTGISSNTYVIQDTLNSSNLISIDDNTIKMSKNVMISRDIGVKDLIQTSNNTVTLTSNVHINLIDPTDTFTVSSASSNSKIVMKTNNFIIKDLNNSNRFSMNDTNINFSKDVYVNDGTLYVNAISGISSALLIENAKYTSTSTEKFTAEQNLSIVNVSTSPDIVSLNITKKSGNANIMSVNTLNNQGTIVNNLTLDNNGLLGIGTSRPDATITISKVNPNIINYKGSNIDDIFKLTQYADIGIGTTNPIGQLHIKRIDDNTNEKKRRNPMINIDLNYDKNNNYSNVYTTYSTEFTGGASSTTSTVMRLYCSTTQNNQNITNNFYLLNSDIYSKMSNNLENIRNIKLHEEATIKFDSINEVDTEAFQLKNTLTYPSSSTIFIQKTDESKSLNGKDYFYDIIMMSEATQLSGGYISDITNPGYNASNFLEEPNSLQLFNQVVSSSIDNIRCIINFIVEKNAIDSTIRSVRYPISYTKTTQVLIPPPYLIYMTSNNAFISSISPYGTLSLGGQSPSSNYLLYAPGTALINTLKVKEFNTENINSNISFMNANLINIDNINCTKLIAKSINVTNIDNSNIICHTGNFSNLNITNLMFENSSNNYLEFTKNNINFKTKLSIGNTNFSQYDNSACEIKVGPEIVAVNQGGFHMRSDGLIVTNMNDGSTINPCITIQTSNAISVPYLNMNNGLSDYNFRLSGVGKNNHFQFTNNRLNEKQKQYFEVSSNAPSIIQHVNESNILAFGQQNIICIDCENKASLHTGTEIYTYNNYSSKVSIGIPYSKLSSDGYKEKEYLEYFQNHINTNSCEYLMNIFGNVCISDISDNPVFTTKIMKDNVATAINGHPVEGRTLNVNGDIYSSNSFTSNITVYDDLYLYVNGVQRSLKSLFTS